MPRAGGNNIILGLTGSLGSGKSFASSLFSKAHAVVLCADEIAHDVVVPGGDALREIEREFGPQVLNPDGSLNRKELAGIVFSDSSRRLKLEQIVHPRVRARMENRIEELRDFPLVVVDVPLLFEKGFDALCNLTLVVTITEEERLRRLQRDRGMTTEEVMERLAAQMAQEEKIRRADYLVDNSQSRSQTCIQVACILDQLFPSGLPQPLTRLDCSL